MVVAFNNRLQLTGTTSDLESNPKYITFPNSARIEFHYHDHVLSNEEINNEYFQHSDLGFIPLEDVVGPDMYIHGQEEKKK